MQSKIAKAIALITFGMNFALSYLFWGFQFGSEECADVFVSDADVYNFLAKYHTLIFLMLLIFLFGSALTWVNLRAILRIAILLFSIYFYLILYFQKSLVYLSTGTSTRLVRNTFPIDWIGYLLIFILLIIETTDLARRLRMRGQQQNG